MAHQPTYFVGQDPFLNPSQFVTSNFTPSLSMGLYSNQSLNPANNAIYSNISSNQPLFQSVPMPYTGDHTGDQRTVNDLNHTHSFRSSNYGQSYEHRYQQSLSESGSYGSFSPGQDRHSPSSDSAQTELSQVSSFQYGTNVNNLQVSFHSQDLPGTESQSPPTRPKARRTRTRSTKSSLSRTSGRSWGDEEVTALITRVKSFARGTRDWPTIINTHNQAHYGHDKARYRTEAACRKKFHDHDKLRSGEPTRTYPANRAGKGQGKRKNLEVEVKPAREKTAKITKTARREQTSKRKKAIASGDYEVPAAGAEIAQPSLSQSLDYNYGTRRTETSDHFSYDAGAYESAVGPAPYPTGGRGAAQLPESPLIESDYAATSNPSIGYVCGGFGMWYGPEFIPAGAFSYNTFNQS